MSKLTASDIVQVKGKGFLRNRETDCFSGRIAAPGTVFTAENFADIAAIAQTYGNGKVLCTSRLGVEIPGIPFDKIPDAVSFAESRGLRFGGTGAKIRPVVACKGTTCVYGNIDTHGIAAKIYDEYYIKWNGVALPHKFKIGVGGCPNSCVKPSLNDFGVEGVKIPSYNAELCRGCKVCAVETACPMKCAKCTDGKLAVDGNVCKDCGVCVGKCPFKAVAHEGKVMYKVYVGGTWGKSTRMGTPLSRFIDEGELLSVLEKSMLWYKENGFAKERFGKTIDRIGFDLFEKELFGGDILERKQAIIDAEVKAR